MPPLPPLAPRRLHPRRVNRNLRGVVLAQICDYGGLGADVLTIAVARDLARLQTALVALVGTAEGNEAQEQLEGHVRIAQQLLEDLQQ